MQVRSLRMPTSRFGLSGSMNLNVFHLINAKVADVLDDMCFEL